MRRVHEPIVAVNKQEEFIYIFASARGCMCARVCVCASALG